MENKTQKIDTEARIKRISTIQEEHEELTKKFVVLKDRYETISAAAYFLNKAKIQFSSRYMNPIKHSFDFYYNMLSYHTKPLLRKEEREINGGIYSRDLVLDANLNINLENNGSFKSVDFLSAGHRDLVALCQRLAVIDAMYSNEKPLIILDDPFVNLDDAKMQGAFSFLKEISGRYQILYLTCSNSRYP